MSDETTRIAAVAMNSAMGDPCTNLERIAEICHQAHALGAKFVLFPEECITGSLNKSDLTLKEARQIVLMASKKAVSCLKSLCRELGLTVIVGTIESAGDRFSNSTLIVGPEGYLATFSKLHLPNPTESAWFVPGDTFPIISSQGWTFGVGICYDIRFPEIFRVAAQRGADFFLLAVGGSGAVKKMTSDGDQMGQVLHHKMLAMQLMPARAVDNALYIFYANQSGESGNAIFPGLTLAVDPNGKLIDEHLCGEGMTVTEISRKVLSKARTSGCYTAGKTRSEVYASAQLA